MLETQVGTPVGTPVEIPVEKEPDRFTGKLGKRVLMHTYGEPTWGQFEEPSFMDKLRRKRGQKAKR